MGCGREFEFEFAPDGQEIFALLPYRIEDVSAEIASRGENRFEVRIRVAAGEGESTFHTLRVELADPTGKVRPEYSSWVRTDRGRASWQWTAPLNAPEGKWHLRITETISGKSRTLELPVRP